MDPQTRFSSSFLDDPTNPTPTPSDTPQNNLIVATNTDTEKRFSDHFAVPELELHPHDEQFDFASNLQTHDSVSSLTNIGLTSSSPTEAVDASESTQTAPISSGSWETFEDKSAQKVGYTICCESISQDIACW